MSATLDMLKAANAAANALLSVKAEAPVNAASAPVIAPRRVKCPPADGAASCSNCMLYHGPAAPVKSVKSVKSVKAEAPKKRGIVTVTPVSDEAIAAFPFRSERIATAAEAVILGTRTVRDTKNPTWADVEWALSVKAGYVVYTRLDDAKGSPLAKLDAAIMRALKLGLKGVQKLAAVPHATDKGVWLLVKYP